MSKECCTFTDLGWCPLDSPAVPYTNPIDDKACWYDPDIPESADFLGLFVVGVDGLEDDTHVRSTSDVSATGTVFNRPTRPGKVLTWDVILLATSCCGMDYGRDWLATVLRGQGCAHGANKFTEQCGTTELNVRVCCPEEGHDDTGMRHFPSVSLTQGLQRLDKERRDKCCCTYRRFSFVITTGTPDSFGDLQEICDNPLDIAQYQCPPCIDENPPYVDPCADPLDCFEDYAEAFASPSLSLNCGFCTPVEVTRNCCCIDEFQVGSTSRTLIIDLFAGNDPNNQPFSTNGARNIELLVWENPKKLPCPTTQDEFEYFVNNVPLCARIKVAHITAGSQMRIDGRTGQAYVICQGRQIPIYDAVEGDLKKLDTGCNPLVVCSLWDRTQAVYPPEANGKEPSRMRVSVARRYS
jgi:hypothetical protein